MKQGNRQNSGCQFYDYKCYQIPQKEVSSEASMVASLVNVPLVQPINNIYCSTTICTYLMIKLPLKIPRQSKSELVSIIHFLVFSHNNSLNGQEYD